MVGRDAKRVPELDADGGNPIVASARREATLAEEPALRALAARLSGTDHILASASGSSIADHDQHVRGDGPVASGQKSDAVFEPRLARGSALTGAAAGVSGRCDAPASASGSAIVREYAEYSNDSDSCDSTSSTEESDETAKEWMCTFSSLTEDELSSGAAFDCDYSSDTVYSNAVPSEP